MPDFSAIEKVLEIEETPEGTPEGVSSFSLAETEADELQENLPVVKTPFEDERYKVEDDNYIKTELQDNIQQIGKVMEDLQGEITTGAPARMYEVYATLAAQRTASIKELKDFNQRKAEFKLKTDIAKTQKAVGPNLGTGNTINNTTINMGELDPSKLLDMAIKARKDSIGNAVKADFNIVGV